MSLDKAIQHGKEKRKAKYYDSRDFDHTCRSHGDCPWCAANRKHKVIKQQKPLETEEEE